MMSSSHRKLLFLGPLFLAAGSVAYFTLRYWWDHHRKKTLTQARSQNSKPFYELKREPIVINSVDEWNEHFPLLEKELNLIKAVGLDCEWVPGDNPVSILQLATPSGFCLLVRMSRLTEIPASLRTLLSDKGILKLGVACVDDGYKLHKEYGLCVRGCVDLRYLAARSRMLKLGNYGLKDLAEGVLGVTLDKRGEVRRGNWEAEPLTQEQIMYAAADAAVAVDIFVALVHKKFSSLTTRPHYSQVEFWQKALTMCQGIVDVGFSFKIAGIQSPNKKLHNNHKVDLQSRVNRAYTVRKLPLYHNCQLWAPDGQLLCTCDVKKALWYIDKGLGVKVKDDPFTVRLKFEPSGRPMESEQYYLQEKDNICVVCGKESSYIRKNIVPHEYRKHFPTMMKEHSSHDIVLMCTTCHQQSGVLDSLFKQKLADQCQAPFSTEDGIKYRQDPNLQKIRSAAKALLKNQATLPLVRKQELDEIVQNYFGVQQLDQELLQEASELDVKIPNDKFVSHGQKVVQHMMEHEGLLEFERLWRQHFLDTMQPLFLPGQWSVDHRHTKLATMTTGMAQILTADRPSTSTSS